MTNDFLLFADSDNNEISKMLQFVPQVGDIFDVKDKVGEGKLSLLNYSYHALLNQIFRFSFRLFTNDDLKIPSFLFIGTFSKVFRAATKHSAKKQEFALKYLIPTSKPSRIASELLCLKEIG